MTAFDWRSAVQPLLDACPGSKAVACCYRCGQAVDSPADLDDNGFIVHPGECPPTPTPEGMLL